jgi:hypothetical protein
MTCREQSTASVECYRIYIQFYHFEEGVVTYEHLLVQFKVDRHPLITNVVLNDLSSLGPVSDHLISYRWLSKRGKRFHAKNLKGPQRSRKARGMTKV